MAKKIVLLFVFAKSFLRQGTFDCHVRAHTVEKSFKVLLHRVLFVVYSEKEKKIILYFYILYIFTGI